MRALVIGGGIGGPVAAVALRCAGIEATVHEAQHGPAEQRGLFLGLGVNGMRVLRELDLLGTVLRADVISTPIMEFSSTTGKTLGRVSNGWVDAQTSSITLMRGTLQRALLESAEQQGIEVRYGERLVEYVREKSRIIARFDSGVERAADVLIGADGIHSQVRRQMFPDGPRPTYTGLLNVGPARVPRSCGSTRWRDPG